SPTPKFDNPKMDDCAALQLFGAGREKRIYAIPPHTKVVSLDFEDHPFEPSRTPKTCGLCGADDTFLDEVITDDKGGRLFVCSDTDHCEKRRAAGSTSPRARGEVEPAADGARGESPSPRPSPRKRGEGGERGEVRWTLTLPCSSPTA